MLIMYAFRDDEMMKLYAEPTGSMSTVLCRFLCSIILHVSLCNKTKGSFQMMKYAMNHYWKFDSWFTAFLVGFFQMLVLMSVEFVNMAVLLSIHDIIEIIMNFLALVIITNFDEFFFATDHHEKLFKLLADGKIELNGKELTLDDLTKIETTSSEHARFHNKGNILNTWKPNPKQPEKSGLRRARTQMAKS